MRKRGRDDQGMNGVCLIMMLEFVAGLSVSMCAHCGKIPSESYEGCSVTCILVF